MSQQNRRAVFWEGQIVGADDLALALDHPRAQVARHQRGHHTHGIASGLALTLSDDQESVFVEAGRAIDGHGQEIVLAQRVELVLKDLTDAADPQPGSKDSYPLFLSAEEREQGGSPRFGGCTTGQASRVVEGYRLEFGAPHELPTGADQQPTGVSGGPGDGGALSAWRLLLGYVEFDADGSSFEGTGVPAKAWPPRWIGVRAAEVRFPGGTGTPSPSVLIGTGEPGQDGAPVLQVSDHADGGASLTFGRQGADGGISSLFSVDSNGNVTAAGTIKAPVQASFVESGSASHGCVLPLPAGVTQEDVDEGRVLLVDRVWPRRRMGASSLAEQVDETLISDFALEAFVDQERRVHCLRRVTRFTPLGPGPALSSSVTPGLVDYLVTAVAADAGSGGAS